MGTEQRNKDQVYTIDGIEYPSVSKILNVICEPEPLMYYACNKLIEKFIKLLSLENDVFDVNETRKCVDILNALKNSKDAHIEYRDERAELGTAIHHAFEDHINGKIDLSLEQKIIDIVDLLIKWTKGNDVKWLVSERTVHNPFLCYAGTLDAIAVIKGCFYYVDFKTSKNIYDKHKMQLCAYAYADTHQVIVDNEPVIIDKFGCMILQINIEEKTIKEHYIKQAEIEHKYNSFLHLLAYFYSVKKRKINNHRAIARN